VRYETPVGSIESVQNYVSGMYCYAYEKHFVETIDDFRVMRFVFEHTTYAENYQEYLSRDRLWGEDGIGFAMAVASMAPMQKMLSRWAGVETTVLLCQDHPEEVSAAFTAIEDCQEPLVEILAGSPAEVVILPENLASQVVGERFFRQFNMPYYARVVRRLHAAGKKVAIHIDGGLTPCLGLLSSCGFDIAEAVTPAPFGDIAVEDLRKVAGPDIIIWGGLPGGIFSRNYSDEYFEQYVLNVLRNADGRFVLGVADQVPPDAEPRRIGRVRELVQAHPRKEAASLGKA
jgi:uroporphyrinogen-III decarboxylase